jgi:hypothetical protein
MLLVVIENGLAKGELLAAGAPKGTRARAIRAPLNPEHSANSFGQGGTPLATAMRLAVNTKAWFGVKPYFYEISDDAKPALTAMKSNGRKLRTFPIVDESAFRKALIIVDFLVYGGSIVENDLIRQSGFDPDELRAKTSAILDNFSNNPPNAEYIGTRGNINTRIAAYVLHEALSGRLDEIIG